MLRPRENNYFVLEPKHSGFSTTLDLLLVHMGVETVLIGGIATDICILFTANDAYMRDDKVIVPPDCDRSSWSRERRTIWQGPCTMGRWEGRQMAMTRRSSSSTGGRRYGRKAGQKVEKTMHEMKRGALRSGGSGKKVTSRKQAIAIGLSQARKEGAKVPRKRGTFRTK